MKIGKGIGVTEQCGEAISTVPPSPEFLLIDDNMVDRLFIDDNMVDVLVIQA